MDPENVMGSQRKKNDAWDYLIDPERKIGYVRVTKFRTNTARDLNLALEKLRAQGMNGLILDLRFSQGGYLVSVVSAANVFLKDGVITRVRGRNSEEVYQAEGEGKFRDLPLVCLVNRETAATSEVLAACLQDYHRATIVGERSSGRAHIKNIIPIGEGEVRLPAALFYRANDKKLDRMPFPGRPADEWGVSPDKGYDSRLSLAEQKQLASRLRETEMIRHWPPMKQNEPMHDRQLEMALDLLKEKIKISSTPNR